MTRGLSLGVAVLAAGFAAAVQAQPASSADAERLALASRAAACAACHGTQGRPVVPDLVPGLAGRPRDELIDKMRALRDDKVGATVMPQILKGYSERQLEQLADYFARQPR